MKLVFLLLLLFSVAVFCVLLVCPGLENLGICNLITENYLLIGAGSIHMGLFSAAMFYLWKKDAKAFFKRIGFPGDIPRNIILSGAGFILVMVVLLILGITLQLLGFDDQDLVFEKVSGLPWYILAFAILLAPISEELFFRALLVPRFGIIVSSVMFGLMHFAYGSIVEIVGAALIGMVLAIMYKISKSITPCLIIHITYNLLSIIVMRFYM